MLLTFSFQKSFRIYLLYQILFWLACIYPQRQLPTRLGLLLSGREALDDMMGGMASEGGVGGVFGGLVYSIQLNRRDEPSINKLSGVLCVAQDRKVICKDDYSGDSRALVFIMNHHHHQHQIRL